MKFIDLYAGIGGFRFAAESFGHECVFSAEVNQHAINTYKENFGEDSTFDMNSIADMSNEEIDELIPDHDLVCGGFPCQTFSIGGNKKGFDELRGTQFFNILKIVKVKSPKYIFLENVAHITKHDNGNTFKVIRKELLNLGYDIGNEPIIASPDSFGIPQRRLRSFMIAKKNSEPLEFSFPERKTFKSAIDLIIEKNTSGYDLDGNEKKSIEAWNEFISSVKADKIPTIWIDQMISDEWNEGWQEWKKRYVLKMRVVYKENKIFIDKWLKKYELQKITNVKFRRLEWLCGDMDRTLNGKIITIRQSGVRVSRPNLFPTLVASVETPIFYDDSLKSFRWMSVSEMGKLQSFPDKFKPSQRNQEAYKMFGNSVNIDVIKYFMKGLK